MLPSVIPFFLATAELFLTSNASLATFLLKSSSYSIPIPKNPTIAKFFEEIGWVDELGSGVRNIYKYNKVYSGAESTFIEGDVFKTIIPLIPQVTPQVDANDDGRIREILEFCKIPKGRKEIQKLIEIKDTKDFKARILNPLIKGGLLKLTIPEKPTSPKQKYYYEKR